MNRLAPRCDRRLRSRLAACAQIAHAAEIGQIKNIAGQVFLTAQ